MKLLISLIFLWVLSKYDKPPKKGNRRKNLDYQGFAMKNNLMGMFK
jgi:hypothetical protein